MCHQGVGYTQGVPPSVGYTIELYPTRCRIYIYTQGVPPRCTIFTRCATKVYDIHKVCQQGVGYTQCVPPSCRTYTRHTPGVEAGQTLGSKGI